MNVSLLRQSVFSVLALAAFLYQHLGEPLKAESSKKIHKKSVAGQTSRSHPKQPSGASHKLSSSQMRKIETKKPLKTPGLQESLSASAGQQSATKPVLVATYGQWQVYKSQSLNNKICFAITTPSSAKEKAVGDYFFLTNRPNEGIYQEAYFKVNVPVKPEGKGHKVKVGKSSFNLLTTAKGDVWLENEKKTSVFLAELEKNQHLILSITPQQGPPLHQTYSLTGLTASLKRINQDCR